ncbi:hypothetical protein V6C27_00950 [Peptococcaceae bacterium 1198_IL3148]
MDGEGNCAIGYLNEVILLISQHNGKNNNMMTNKTTIYQFPTTEDRHCAETALMTFLNVQSGLSRLMMLSALKSILNKYHLSKLKLAKCIIELNHYDEVVVKPRKFIATKNCPTCGEDLYTVDSKIRIISICQGATSEFVTYGCQCGDIFGKVEKITH